MSGFYDLNIPYVDQDCTRAVLKKLANFGYRTVALNHTIDVDKAFKGVDGAVDHFAGEEFAVEGHRFPLKIVNRLTLVLAENAPLYLLTNDKVQSYDILAVSPCADKQFHKICTEVEIDIVCLDLCERLPFNVRMPPVRAAIERGVHFEIQYSPALTGSSPRCNTISNAKNLVRLARSKNILMSSQANTDMAVRSPYDIINLGLLFDLSADQSRKAISRNGRRVLYHADARRGLGKAAVRVQNISSLGQGQHWQVKSIEDCRKISDDDDEDCEGSTDEDDGESVPEEGEQAAAADVRETENNENECLALETANSAKRKQLAANGSSPSAKRVCQSANA